MIVFLYQLPTWTMALVVVGAIVAVSVGAMLALRSWVQSHWAQYTDSINFYVSASGVIYAVLLAMIAVAAWEGYDDLDERVADEASVVGSLFRDAEGLPPETRARVRGYLREYVRDTLERVWPMLASARELDRRELAPDENLRNLIGELARFKPADLGEANIHRIMLEKQDRLITLRRQRLLSAEGGLMPLLWVVVLVGAAVNIGLTFLVTSEDRLLSIILTGSYSMLVGVMIFAVLALDHPLWGQISVEPEPFRAVSMVMNQLMPILK